MTGDDPKIERISKGARDASNPWLVALGVFSGRLRRALPAIAICAVIGCGAGVAFRMYSTPTYFATAQLLFDAQGLRIFNNSLTTGHADANSAINFVESQMGVLRSERVLSRVMDAGCAAAASPKGAENAPLPQFFTRFCPQPGPAADPSKALTSLRNALSLKRIERSFVVDVTAAAPTPQSAAFLASAIVQAYRDEDAANRARAAGKLTAELDARLAELRRNLKDAETRAQAFKRKQNLVRIDGKLLVEGKLAAANVALNEARVREDRALARVKQLASVPPASNAPGTLGADVDTRNLQMLIERRNGVLVENAALSARAGARHPALMEVRGRLSEVERNIATEMGAIRRVAQSDLSRARAEQAILEETVNKLTVKVTEANQAEIALRAIEQEIDTTRKLVDTFAVRAREAREFGQVDSGNLREVSLARAPQKQNQVPRLVLAGLVGMLLAIFMALGCVALLALLEFNRVTNAGKAAPQRALAGNRGGAYEMQMRARAFAESRYG